MDLYENDDGHKSDPALWLRGYDGGYLPGLWRDGRVHCVVAADIKKLMSVLILLPELARCFVVKTMIRDKMTDSRHVPKSLINHLFVTLKKTFPETDVRGLLVLPDID
jgi:hypothetical protein